MRLFLLAIFCLLAYQLQAQSIYEGVQIDTTYGYQTTQMTKYTKLATESVQQDRFYLNSKSNAFIKGGKNRVVFPVNLPANTVAWYYTFTASRNEEEIKTTMDSFSLAAVLSKFIDDSEKLSNGVKNMGAPPSANICDIYLLDDTNAKLFKEKEAFDYSINGSRENYKSGIVKVDDLVYDGLYLGVQNPDTLHGIHVGFELVAIVEDYNIVEEQIRIPVIISSKK